MSLTLTPMTTIAKRNAAAGAHWFEPATLRFFKSRFGAYAYTGAGGTYFVSSEKCSGARRYTVRQVAPDGSVSTAGEFQEFATNRVATARARLLASGEVTP